MRLYVSLRGSWKCEAHPQPPNQLQQSSQHQAHDDRSCERHEIDSRPQAANVTTDTTIARVTTALTTTATAIVRRWLRLIAAHSGSVEGSSPIGGSSGSALLSRMDARSSSSVKFRKSSRR